MRTKLSPALALSIVVSFAIPAAAATQHVYTITADKEAGVCRVNPRQEDSGIVQFWDNLQADAAKQRLEELEAQVPGIKPAIEAYDTQQPSAQSPGELQEMLTQAGAAEGVGMLAPHREAAADGVPGADNEPPELTYTVEQAESAAKTIADNPTGAAEESLKAQSASGLRIAKIQEDLFAQRKGEFESLQKQLRKDLQDCAKQLKGRPLGLYLTGGVVLLGVLVLGLVAVMNSRKRNRHELR